MNLDNWTCKTSTGGFLQSVCSTPDIIAYCACSSTRIRLFLTTHAKMNRSNPAVTPGGIVHKRASCKEEKATRRATRHDIHHPQSGGRLRSYASKRSISAVVNGERVTGAKRQSCQRLPWKNSKRSVAALRSDAIRSRLRIHERKNKINNTSPRVVESTF